MVFVMLVVNMDCQKIKMNLTHFYTMDMNIGQAMSII